MKYEVNEDILMRLVEYNRNILLVILNSKKVINIWWFLYGI